MFIIAMFICFVYIFKLGFPGDSVNNMM